MIRTRSALAVKVEALEDTISGKVHDVKARVETVKHNVNQAVQKTKEAFDLPRQVREHPWPAFGASIALGLVLGSVSQRLGRSNGPSGHDDLTPGRSLTRRPGMFAEEMRAFRGAAVGALMSFLRDEVRHSFPGIAPQTDRVFDGITRKMGGEPVDDVFQEPRGA
jgi:ElaB/YqjD/DUF883 family membrane-anchored ribosome-binding protein